MLVDLSEKRVEQTLSSVQSKLADMKDLLLIASEEIDELYMTLDSEKSAEPKE